MLLLLAAAVCSAYTVKETEGGLPIRWAHFPVDYAWDGGGPPGVQDPEAELRAAFSRWEDVRGVAIRFDPVAANVRNPVESPDDVHLVWVTADWPFDSDLLALTSSWTLDDTGEIVAFDVRVNGNQPWADDGRPDAFDFRAAMAHEVGHVLGLDHSGLEAATMYATAATGQSWRAELDADDEYGVRFLYPHSEPEVRSSSSSCAFAPGDGGALALLVVTASLLRRTGGSHARSVRGGGRRRVDVLPRSGPGRAG